MAYELAKAYVAIGTDDRRLRSGMAKAQSFVRKSVSTMSAIGKFAGIGIGIGAIAKLTSVMGESVRLAGIQIDAEKRLAAVLRATGGAAGYSAGQLKQYASELQSVTTHGDEEILQLMATIATFKNVSGEHFKQLTELSLDLADTGLGSASGSAMQLAKALEDPARGMSMLRRVGVTFSKQQEDHIKGLQEQNKLWDAQAVLLDAVAGQVDGVSEAMAKTPTGKLKQVENSIGDIKEKLGTALLPAIVNVKTSTLEFYTWLKDTFFPIFATEAANIAGTFGFISGSFDQMVELMKSKWQSFIDFWKPTEREVSPAREQQLKDAVTQAEREYQAAKGTTQERAKLVALVKAQESAMAIHNPFIKRSQRESRTKKSQAEMMAELGDQHADAILAARASLGLGPKGKATAIPGGGSGGSGVSGDPKALLKALGKAWLPDKQDMRSMAGNIRGRGLRWIMENMRGGVADDPTQKSSPWNRSMGMDQLNSAYQQALLDQDNPVHETNKKLDDQTEVLEKTHVVLGKGLAMLPDKIRDAIGGSPLENLITAFN